jgi:hypothetical protein
MTVAVNSRASQDSITSHWRATKVPDRLVEGKPSLWSWVMAKAEAHWRPDPGCLATQHRYGTNRA